MRCSAWQGGRGGAHREGVRAGALTGRNAILVVMDIKRFTGGGGGGGGDPYTPLIVPCLKLSISYLRINKIILSYLILENRGKNG